MLNRPRIGQSPTYRRIFRLLWPTRPMFPRCGKASHRWRAGERTSANAQLRVSLREQSRADCGDLGACDRVFFVVAEGLVEVPAVEVGAVERRADVEVRLERGDDPLERVQVRAVLPDELRGACVLCGSEGVPLP